MQHDWQKVKDVFALVKGQPRARRGELLRELCAGDAALREEVESLLEAGDAPDPLLESEGYGAASIFGAEGGYEGKEFGCYRIIREVGRGGMGAVLLAERADGEFTQRVALKIVRRGFADPELARRFRRERQILATLNHPNVARLLGGGMSADGEPYFVMEYVEGERIDDYCEGRGLTTEERLRLFLKVCRGVAYAHRNLVVHRDIKPSNILVSADGEPKLLDFGIAKLLDAEHADEHTQTRLRAFTPEYASPEQVRGERVSVATDVYSLGVLLEELLVGRQSARGAGGVGAPFRTRGRETRETNLPTGEGDASALAAKAAWRGRAGAELRHIVAAARREEPERRYASVAQFAEDVQRYLEGRPVLAQRDSVTYRAGKFVRRNKVTAAAALVAVAVVVGFGVALSHADAARRQRDRAERRFNDVRRLSGALLSDIAPKLERLEGATEARQALVTQSLRYLDSLAEESGDDPALQSELAAAYEKVGDLQGAPRELNLGDFRGAVASYEKAQAIRRRLVERSGGDARGDAEVLRLIDKAHSSLAAAEKYERGR